jgi:hypothetical protein
VLVAVWRKVNHLVFGLRKTLLEQSLDCFGHDRSRYMPVQRLTAGAPSSGRDRDKMPDPICLTRRTWQIRDGAVDHSASSTDRLDLRRGSLDQAACEHPVRRLDGHRGGEPARQRPLAELRRHPAPQRRLEVNRAQRCSECGQVLGAVIRNLRRCEAVIVTLAGMQ